MIAAPTVETPVETIPIEPKTPMKLSEALRLGSISTKQAIGAYLNPKGEMCALGTLAYVYGYEPGNGEFQKLSEFSFLRRSLNLPKSVDPECALGPGQATLHDLIIHLNDHHRLGRNVIADRLEKIGL